MKLTCLVDNETAKKELGTEHGLSLLIQTAERNILFDTGASGLFAANAAKLGVDLSVVDTVILSHGHYDHGGGLQTFFELNTRAKAYIRDNAFGEFYSVHGDTIRYIGIDKTLKSHPRVVLTDGVTELGRGWTLFSLQSRKDALFSTNANLKEKTADGYRQDGFAHEQNLIVEENGVKVLVAGCAHNGITNIIRGFIDKKGCPPDVVIGGFHLAHPASGFCERDAVIDGLADTLGSYNTAYYTCHCTGLEPYARLKQRLGDKINYIAAGDSINI
ncbi:MAG: MBL fold metallo-hydrolase [Clostridia bacterium]|nr:MBL fold metallo-hydrolase [Clostridia bacterium]